MTARLSSDALHERARAVVRAFERGHPPTESFDSLAVDLVRHQAAYVPGYAQSKSSTRVSNVIAPVARSCVSNR